MDKEIENIDVNEDISFINEEIKKMEKHIKKNEELYDEVYEIMKKTKNMGVNVTGSGIRFKMNMRDFAELGRTLSTIRSSQISAITSKINAKKYINDFKFKKVEKEGIKNDLSEMSRNIIDALHKKTGKEDMREIFDIEDEVEDADISEAEIEELLSKKVALTKNEQAMILDYKGIEVFYNETEECYDVYTKDGEFLPEYPQERLLDYGDISEDMGDYIITNTGKKIKKKNRGKK